MVRAFSIFLPLSVVLGAFLLFVIQPMFGKTLLPFLGGTAATWITLLMFFQGVLFAGYFYAYLLTKVNSVKGQVGIHMALLVASLVWCVSAPVHTTPVLDVYAPIESLLKHALTTVGIPLFMLASSVPLVQRWLAQTQHKKAKKPSVLYALSNLGALVALLAYPFVLEHLFALTTQLEWWRVGYISYVVCALCVGAYVVMSARERTVEKTAPAPTWCMKAYWLVLALVPVSLMMAITTFITYKIAPMPLLWVVPLALYVLSYVLTFMEKPIIPHAFVKRTVPAAIFGVLVITLAGLQAQLAAMLIHVAAFFWLALACHGELAQRKPVAPHLPQYYVWIALGGLLGGVFNAVVAPAVFYDVFEYPIALALACAVLPAAIAGASTCAKGQRVLDIVLPLVFALVVVCSFTTLSTNAFGKISIPLSREMRPLFLTGVVLIFMLFSYQRPLRFSLGVAAVLLVHTYLPHTFVRNEMSVRSFYGVYQVWLNHKNYHMSLVTGRGLERQGVQSLVPSQAADITYFYPLEDIGESLPKTVFDKPTAVIGMGVGALACLPNMGEVAFYEIDPVVDDIARRSEHFLYFDECPVPSTVTIGDGRVLMQEEEDQRFGMVVLDAFSGGGIPTHLLTQEAFALYTQKLDEKGVMLLHLSNRYVDFYPVVAAWAKQEGWHILARNEEDGRPSSWLVLARDPADWGTLAQSQHWASLADQKQIDVWSDERTTLLPLLKW